jgi:hypothetical protein
MKLARRPSLSATVATAALALGVVAGSAGVAHAAYDPANPPYPADPNRATGLTIYDASTGTAVTSGSTTTTLDHYYFAAATDFSPSHTKAAVSGFLAESGKAPGAWSGENLGPATTYPVSGAPASVSALTTPVAKGDSSLTFGSLAGSYPNNAAATSDFFQLYQVRVHTTFPTPQSDSYASADLQVDPAAGTWKVATAGTGVTSTTPTMTQSTDRINVVKQSSVLTIKGTPGDSVSLYADTRPGTTYSVVSTATFPASGTLSKSVSPRFNTLYYAQTTAGKSATLIVYVRPAESLKGTASGRRGSFTGQLVPGHGGVTVRLFAVASGRLTLIGTAKTGTSGAWSLAHTFATAGAKTFISQTVTDSTNLSGQSNRITLTLH